MAVASDLVSYLQEVPPSQVSDALRFAGWERLEGSDATKEYWELRAKDTRLVLPMRRDLADFGFRMQQVAAALVDAYGSSTTALLEVVAVDYDVLRMRAGQAADASGSIPFDDGLQFIIGIKNLFRAAAKASSERRPYFGNRGYQRADRFVSELRLGQSDRGSYVFTILSPLAGSGASTELHDHQPELDIDEALGRSVTKTLVRALASAQRAAKSYIHQPDFVVFMDAVSDGVSADLCQSIVEVLSPPSQAEVSFEVAWAKRVPSAPVETIVFSRELLPPLAAANVRLRATEAPKKARVRGVIKQMTKEELVEGTPFLVSMRVLDGVEAKVVRVRMDWSFFHQAVGAFERGDVLSLLGDVEREGNNFWLYNPTELVNLGSSE